MISLKEVKDYLKIEYDDDDLLLQGLLEAASQYLKNATGKESFDGAENIANTFMLLLISEWYENREYTGKVNNRIKPIITSMIMQLKY